MREPVLFGSHSNNNQSQQQQQQQRPQPPNSTEQPASARLLAAPINHTRTPTSSHLLNQTPQVATIIGAMSKNKTRTKDKYRVVYNDTQRIELENEFRASQYITVPRKQEIAQKLKLSERQIKIWFQNRRAKQRKQEKRKISSLKPPVRQLKQPSAIFSETSNNTHQPVNHLNQYPNLNNTSSSTNSMSVSPPNHNNNTNPSNSHTEQQQQQQHLHHMTCLRSSPISAARSLPDIANLRLPTTSLSTMAPSYTDHQLPTVHDYNYDYHHHDANTNLVQTTSPIDIKYNSDNNNIPQIEPSPQLPTAVTSAPTYNNYPSLHTNQTIQSIVHQPSHSTHTNINYYPPDNNNHHHQHYPTNSAHNNRTISTSIVHPQSNKPIKSEDDFLTDSRVGNGLSSTTEPSYDVTSQFAYDNYDSRNPLSQYIAGCGPQRKLRSSSYNNLESINFHHHHHQAPPQMYTQHPQPQPVPEHMFVPSQHFYN